jgi:sec-independent protein translocase protein TatA
MNVSLLLLPSLGMPELLVILLIVVVVFGASRIPQLGKALGEGIRNLKQGLKDGEADTPKPPEGKSAQS